MNLNSYVTRRGPSQPTFPSLMEVRSGGFIVLFHDWGRGTVVASDGQIYDVGHYSDTWATDAFRPFIGHVTIGDSGSVASDSAADGTTSEAIDLGAVLGAEALSAMDDTMSWCGPGCTCFPDPRGDGEAQTAGNYKPVHGGYPGENEDLPEPIRRIVEALRAAGAGEVRVQKVG